MANYITCDVCGSVIKVDEVRGFCSVCGRRTCVVCCRVCDVCGRLVCQDCIKLREFHRNGKLYFMNICDECWERRVW